MFLICSFKNKATVSIRSEAVKVAYMYQKDTSFFYIAQLLIITEETLPVTHL